jgi:hypothetical protein
MAVEVKVGEIFKSRSGLYKVQVTGFFRRFGKANPGGILFMPVDRTTSGPHQTAITLEEWALEGFAKDGQGGQ